MSIARIQPAALNRFRENFENILFIVPAVAIFAVFYVYPFFEIFRLSFYEWNGISLHREFVGLMNFRELMQDATWGISLRNAGFITLIALTFQNALAFALALACDQDIRMRKFYRVIFYIPPVLSEVVVGMVWSWILYSGTQQGEHIGFLNHMLAGTGLPHLAHNWLSDPATALPCIAVVHSWKGFGWGFIIFLAGLQTIDPQLYEAARIDGAGGWNVFRHVTIPMMVPVIGVVMILTLLGSMQVFVLVLSMVGQGLVYHTAVPVTRILSSMMETNRFGYACAQSIFFGFILIIVSLISMGIFKKMRQA